MQGCKLLSSYIKVSLRTSFTLIYSAKRQRITLPARFIYCQFILFFDESFVGILLQSFQLLTD